MHILSIQSQVVFGHVGNSAVTYPLQRLGHDVWPVPTTILSNHSGYPDVGGQAVAASDIGYLLRGLERRGAFALCELVLCGYLGRADVATVVRNAVIRLRSVNPDLLFCCDPVMGDSGLGLYVDRELPALFRSHLLPLADIATPNLFELELLTGEEPGRLAHGDVGDLVTAARALLEIMRPDACCLVTSAVHRDVHPQQVAVMAIDQLAAWYVETPVVHFSREPHGAGDLISALFAAAMADHGDMIRALEESVAIIFAVLSETRRRERAELDLVASGELIVAPPQQFAAQMVV